GVDTGHGLDDIATALRHVVIGADRNGFEIFLRADHVFHGMAKLVGQLTVRHEHESDHPLAAPVMAPIQAHLISPPSRAAGALSCRRTKRWQAPKRLAQHHFVALQHEMALKRGRSRRKAGLQAWPQRWPEPRRCCPPARRYEEASSRQSFPWRAP